VCIKRFAVRGIELRFVLPVLLVLIATGSLARANLIIVPTFDNSIAGDANAAGIEGTINSAISLFEDTYSNPITVDIYFQEGGGLGESNFLYYAATYSYFYSRLVATDANPAAIAGLQLNGGASTHNPVTGTSQIDIKSANARALGINVAPGCLPTASPGTGVPMECGSGNNPGAGSVDGIISLNTNITYPPNSNNGSSYDLLSTVEHEIDEILGLGSSLPNSTASSGTVNGLAGNPAPEDLFRYGAGGSRIFSVNCAAATQAFFSYNGTTDLAQFDNACNGADFGDWANGSSAQVQDAFASPGAGPAYGSNEMAALSAIGYTLATPEPGTWTLSLLLLAAMAFARRRRTER